MFIVVGCKRDMASENLAKNREVSEEEARAFAHFNNLPYVETSSKTGKILFFVHFGAKYVQAELWDSETEIAPSCHNNKVVEGLGTI